MEIKTFMEIKDFPEHIRNSRWLGRRHLAKLTEVERVPVFDRELCEGTIETACELFHGKEREIVLTRHAIQQLGAGNIEMAWQSLLAIQHEKTYE